MTYKIRSKSEINEKKETFHNFVRKVSSNLTLSTTFLPLPLSLWVANQSLKYAIACQTFLFIRIVSTTIDSSLFLYSFQYFVC